ncbi:hypothetical protein D9M70_615260 [compost metagenome]
MLPLAVFLGDCDEIIAEEDAGYARHRKKLCSELRCVARACRVTEICRPFRHDNLAWKKLQGRRVRRSLGLDEHIRSPLSISETVRKHGYARRQALP